MKRLVIILLCLAVTLGISPLIPQALAMDEPDHAESDLSDNVIAMNDEDEDDDWDDEDEDEDDEDDEDEDDEDEDDDWDDDEGDEEELAKVLDFLKTHVPEMAERLDKIGDEDEYHDIIGDWAEQIEYYNELMEEDTQTAASLLVIMKNTPKAAKLAEEARDATGSARKEVVKRLRSVLSEMFDSQLKLKMYEIKFLEQEIKEIQEICEKRRDNKDRILSHRLEELLEEDDELLEWW